MRAEDLLDAHRCFRFLLIGKARRRAKRSGVEVDAVHPAILAVTQNVQFCEIGAHFGRKRHDLVDF